jgi:uncharacterized protein YggE
MFATLSLGLLITGALAWSGRGAVAQGPDTKDRQRTIHTAGTGTVRIRPDRARVFIGVQTYAATVKQARSQNAAQTKQVTDALTALKIPDLKMKSTNMTVELIPADVEGSRTPKVAGYRVTNTFTALIANDDPERLGPLAGRVLDTALESGANLVQQIVFFKEDTAPREAAGADQGGGGRTGQRGGARHRGAGEREGRDHHRRPAAVRV